MSGSGPVESDTATGEGVEQASKGIQQASKGIQQAEKGDRTASDQVEHAHETDPGGVESVEQERSEAPEGRGPSR